MIALSEDQFGFSQENILEIEGKELLVGVFFRLLNDSLSLAEMALPQMQLSQFA